ncbi:MAG: hypothetical protein J5J06_17320 [Phycisphaerae bacterium]|nr:hypothetical protein [Phycisphaerae bacterium]
MIDRKRAAEIFRQAADLNRNDPHRRGSRLDFPNYGQLVMTGDLHGHRRNFEKLQRYCDLAQYGARHVILHEIIHEDVETLDGPDTSHEVLLEAARWKCEFPDQVHFLQSNHELAQIHRHEITKNGRIVTVGFERSVAQAYDDPNGEVLEAINEFIRSHPLAGRTANRVFCSHSLPGPRELPAFDPTVLDRIPTEADLAERGAGHMLVWGRYHTAPALETLRSLLDADFFLCGHQPQETGYDILHGCMVILASDHNHGVFLPLDLGKPVTIESLTNAIRPLAGVA